MTQLVVRGLNGEMPCQHGACGGGGTSRLAKTSHQSAKKEVRRTLAMAEATAFPQRRSSGRGRTFTGEVGVRRTKLIFHRIVHRCDGTTSDFPAEGLRRAKRCSNAFGCSEVVACWCFSRVTLELGRRSASLRKCSMS